MQGAALYVLIFFFGCANFGNTIRVSEEGLSNALPRQRCEASIEEECEDTNNLRWPWDNWGKPVSPATPTDKPPFKVKYLLYKNPDNSEQYEEIFINDIASVTKANPYAKDQAPWKILAHGFTNSKDSQFPQNVKKAYLEHLRQQPDQPLNLLVFDWSDGAKIDLSSFLKLRGVYQNAVENTRPAGVALGNMIAFLHKERFLNITSGLHLIGHSLGAHVAGHAARQVFDQTGSLVWRVSALDPAGPLFWRSNILWWVHQPYPRIHRNRAAFVDVYHTSELYGSKDQIGDVDFYINGGREQPSCRMIGYRRTQSCSHQFAPEVFAKSINDPTMLACTGCYNYAEFLEGNATCNGECEEWPVLGEYADKDTIEGYPSASGEAFFKIDKL